MRFDNPYDFFKFHGDAMTISCAPSVATNKRSEFLQFVYLTLPIMLSVCVTNLVGFFDRTFLAHHSIEALEGYVSGFVLSLLFQTPLMRLTTLGQSFVSFYDSANERHRVGESVWQMIWASFLSMIITLPLGYGVAPFVFGGTAVQEPATSYFTWVLCGNFLFPLQAALSSFFIGQKKAKIVFITVLTAQCVHALLDYLLIFGIENYIPALGTTGAAISLLGNQIVACAILFSLFLRKKERETYGTDHYRFNWTVFWRQMRASVPLSIAPLISIACWVAVSRFMAVKGGGYVIIFSVGSSLTVCFAFMNDALFQSVMTSISGILGKGNIPAIKKVMKHAVFLLGIMMSVLAVPFIIYPEALLSMLFSRLPPDSSLNSLSSTCYSSWLFILCEGFLFIGMGLLAATRKTLFFILTSCLQWLTCYSFVVVAIDFWHWHEESFWLLISANALIIGMLYFLKAKQQITRYTSELL
jgi:MATE family multidrug resistance protein